MPHVNLENEFSISGTVSSTNGISGDIRYTVLKGKDGANAYELAVQNGYEGTEQEWLNSLRAPAFENYIHIYDTKYDFPNVGEEKHLYVDASNGTIYMYWVKDNTYLSVGVGDDDIIYGGDSSED